MTRAFPALLALCAMGCPPPDAAQASLTATSRALVEVDTVLGPAYETAAREALESSSTLEEYREAMGPWDGVEAGLRATRVALLSAQDSLDFWRTSSGTSATFLTSLPALIGAIRGIVRRLPDLGVDVPEALTEALGLLAALSGAGE